MEPCGCCAKRMCASCLSDTRSIPQFNLPNPVLICGACSQVIDQHDQDVKAAKDAKDAKRKDRRGESPGARGVPTTPRPEKRGGGSPRSSRASTPRSNARTKEREKLLELKAGDKSDDEDWYLICSKWLRKWRSWSRHDSQEERPGPITNENLLTSSGLPNRSLKPEKHYRAINVRAWDHLVEIYGGGPAITAARIDIKDAVVETDYTEITYDMTSEHESQRPDTAYDDSESRGRRRGR